MALPNLRLYYWASQLPGVDNWTFAAQQEPLLLADRRAISPGGYVHLLYDKSRLGALPSPTVVVVRMWRKAARQLGWSDRVILETHLQDNELPKNLQQIKGHRKWYLIGITKLGNIWVDNGLLSFTELQKQCELMGNQYLR